MNFVDTSRPPDIINNQLIWPSNSLLFFNRRNSCSKQNSCLQKSFEGTIFNIENHRSRLGPGLVSEEGGQAAVQRFFAILSNFLQLCAVSMPNNYELCPPGFFFSERIALYFFLCRINSLCLLYGLSSMPFPDLTAFLWLKHNIFD